MFFLNEQINFGETSGHEIVIRLRGTNKSEQYRPYTYLQRRDTDITLFNMDHRRHRKNHQPAKELSNREVTRTNRRRT